VASSNERKISRLVARSLLFFDDETKAYAGKRALIQLDSEYSVGGRCHFAVSTTALESLFFNIERFVRVWHGLSYGGKRQVAITCSL
jgi:hypothetical protein